MSEGYEVPTELPGSTGHFYIQDNKEEHITTIRSEAERVINRTLPVCRPLTEVMSVQHYRSYEAFLLGSRSSLVVFKEKSECT